MKVICGKNDLAVASEIRTHFAIIEGARFAELIRFVVAFPVGVGILCRHTELFVRVLVECFAVIEIQVRSEPPEHYIACSPEQKGELAFIVSRVGSQIVVVCKTV